MGSIDISKLEHGMQPLQYEFFPTKIIFPPQTASIMIRSHALLQAVGLISTSWPNGQLGP